MEDTVLVFRKYTLKYLGENGIMSISYNRKKFQKKMISKYVHTYRGRVCKPTVGIFLINDLFVFGCGVFTAACGLSLVAVHRLLIAVVSLVA